MENQNQNPTNVNHIDEAYVCSYIRQNYPKLKFVLMTENNIVSNVMLPGAMHMVASGLAKMMEHPEKSQFFRMPDL